MSPLLARRARSDKAFERMYRRHVLEVYRYALVVLRRPKDAEDVTQTTFLNAYRAFRDGEAPRNQRSWLLGIAHDVCAQRAALRPAEFQQLDGTVDDEGPTEHDMLHALGRLPFNQRAALVMREVDGRSYQEISEILNISANAVETLVFRARRALREQLEGTLACRQAERAISRRLDGRLRRADRAALRKHLRECGDCASFARSQQAQRTALRRFARVQLPSELGTFFLPDAADRKFSSAVGSL